MRGAPYVRHASVQWTAGDPAFLLGIERDLLQRLDLRVELRRAGRILRHAEHVGQDVRGLLLGQ